MKAPLDHWADAEPFEDGHATACMYLPKRPHRDGYVRLSKGWPGGQMAHRQICTAVIGPVADELDLDHLCRNPACVNPGHLDPVPHRENVLRGVSLLAKNAKKTHCDYGHEFTPENVYLFRGSRFCRKCNLRRSHELRARRRAQRAAQKGV